jgi:hypothetical protein
MNKRRLIFSLLALSTLPSMGCRSAHDHEIYVSENGFQLPLPTNWIQWDAEKLKSPDALEAHLVGYAEDPESKALVAVSRLPYQRSMARYAVNSNSMRGLKPEDQSALFDILLQQCQKDIAEGKEYFELISSHHSDITKEGEKSLGGGFIMVKVHGYFLELIAQSRKPGGTLQWLKFLLLMPKNDDQVMLVRISAPFTEKSKYQSDLDFLDSGLQPWIDGSK